MLSLLTRAQARRRRVAATAAQADLDAFLDVARRSFVRVQQAWDSADLQALSTFATEPLLEELREQLAERGPAANCTEVLRLEARVLALEDLSEAKLASVEFSGLIRERASARAEPFRELWFLAQLHGQGCDWRLARVQSLS